MIFHSILVIGLSQVMMSVTSSGNNDTDSTKNSVEHLNQRVGFRLPTRAGNFSLKSRIKKIWQNKTVSEIFKKIPILNGSGKLKICICDPKIRPCCPERPPSMVMNRQSEKTKANGTQKTYLDRIVDKERQFRKTSVVSYNAPTQPLPMIHSTKKSCTVVNDESSTVFSGSIECPLDKKRMEYYLWVRPNKKKRTVLCVHAKRLKPKKLNEAILVNKKE